MATDLSIIIPAYNEERRIKSFLSDMIDFSAKLKHYEVIIVNDGSTDSTEKIVDSMIKSKENFRITSHDKNLGKGAAIKTGVFEARGKSVIFIDADGSIKPSEIPEMARNLDKYDVVIGSRTRKESEVIQPRMRKYIGGVFNLYSNVLFNTGVDDTLCGFKGFRRDVARDIFSDLLSDRWIFDVEILYKIRKRKYTLYRQPIMWEHKEDTKIKRTDPLKMIFQLLWLRLRLMVNSN